MLHRLNKTEKTEKNKVTDSAHLLSLLTPPPIILLRKPPLNPPNNHIYLTQQSIPSEIKKIIQQSQNEISKGDILDATEHLRKGKQITKFSKQKILNNIILLNLAICYYKIGLLQESFSELSSVENNLKDIANQKKVQPPNNYLMSNNDFYVSLYNRLKVKRIRGKICLQICILFSQLGKHEMAEKYAKIGCKIHFTLLYDTLVLCNGIILRYLNESKYFRKRVNSTNCSNKRVEQCEEQIYYIQLPQIFNRIVNIISILTHLLENSKDLKDELLTKGKDNILNAQYQALSKYGELRLQVNLEDFMDDISGQWYLKNKILHQVQMQYIKKEELLQSSSIQVTNNMILQQITYLAVSFYCLSTEARFLEKNNIKQDQNEVLDSEHWLSNSLEIAYTFLPPEAPIVGQIYTVHNKFHGIDKQAIPQDKEMQGSVKILKPLRRPKSTYNSKISILGVPILIRIQTPKNLILYQNTTKQQEDLNEDNNPMLHYISNKNALKKNSITLDLQDRTSTSKKNKNIPKKLDFLNSLEKIYKNQVNKIPKIDNNQSNSNSNKKESVSIQKSRKMTPQENLREGNNTTFGFRRPKSNDPVRSIPKKQYQTIDIMNGIDSNMTGQNNNNKFSKSKKIEIDINNLFVGKQTNKQNEDSSSEVQPPKSTRKTTFLQPKSIKQIGKRNIYYGRRNKISNAILQETNAESLIQF